MDEHRGRWTSLLAMLSLPLVLVLLLPVAIAVAVLMYLRATVFALWSLANYLLGRKAPADVAPLNPPHFAENHVSAEKRA